MDVIILHRSHLSIITVKVISYCYHSVNVISFYLTQRNHNSLCYPKLLSHPVKLMCHGAIKQRHSSPSFSLSSLCLSYFSLFSPLSLFSLYLFSLCFCLFSLCCLSLSLLSFFYLYLFTSLSVLFSLSSIFLCSLLSLYLFPLSSIYFLSLLCQINYFYSKSF